MDFAGIRGSAHFARRGFHCSDDVHIARAATKVAGERAADLLLGRIGVLPEQLVRRHRGIPACRSRTATRGAREKLPAMATARRCRPAIQPSRCWRPPSARQTRCSFAPVRPLIKTVQAPQTPWAQPTWVPVSLNSLRRKSASSRRASTRRSTLRPFTDIRTRIFSSLTAASVRRRWLAGVRASRGAAIRRSGNPRWRGDRLPARCHPDCQAQHRAQRLHRDACRKASAPRA